MTRVLSIFILLFTLFFGSNILAQDVENIIILSGKITDESGRKLPGVSVIVKQNGSTLETLSTASNGKFGPLELEYGNVYTIVIKQDGYVTKTVVADAKKGYFAEDIENPNIDFSIPTSLVKKMPDTDYSVLEDKPVARFEIDASGQFNPNVTYINQRTSEINKYLQSLANKANEQEEKFNQLVADADKDVKSGNYDQAIQKYEEALKIKEDESVETKIADAENKLAELEEQKKLDDQFNAAIKKGDGFLASNKFDQAIAAYNEAKGIKPDDKVPDQKIAEANKKKADADAAAVQKQYDDKMKEADAAFAAKDYGNAKSLYQEASNVKPDEQAPKKKIDEINEIIKNQMEQEQKYNQFLADGNQAMLNKNYESAITSFEEALKIKPNEEIPKNELEKAKNLLAEEKANAEKEQQYNDLIAKADGEFDGGNLEQAKSTYQEALGVKPGEKHPTDRIAEIDAKLAEQADAAAKEQQYNDLIAKADGEFDGGNLEQAKSTYQEALGVKPGEKHPTDRIAEIDAKFAEQADAAAKEQQYNDLIAKADGEFDGGNLEQAKSTYQEALGVKPGEKHPTDRIAEIDAKLAEQVAGDAKEKEYQDLIAQGDQAKDNKSWEEAKDFYKRAHEIKPEETLTQTKVNEVNELMDKEKVEEINAQYQKVLDVADKLLSEGNYDKARELYNRAKTMNPTDTYPDQKLKELEDKIAAESENAAKDKQYNEAIAKADNEFESEKWDQALVSYQTALSIKPTEQYPKDQIETIKAKQAEIASAANEEIEKRNQYDALIAAGNASFNSSNWEEAKNKYTEALTLFSNESYPKDQISKINQKLAELAAANQAANAEKELRDKYNAAIAKADAARDGASTSNQYEAAKDLYKAANTILPTESYPQEQVDWINKKLEDLANDEVNKQYQKLIDVADQKFADKDYETAKKLFTRATGMRPDDSYPPKKIKEIDAILANLAAQQANEAEVAALLKKYNDAIAKADAKKDAKSYDEAKDLYKKASQIKPDETYPQEMIDWINAEMKKELADELEKQYRKIIAVADQQLEAKKYDKAIQLYERAGGMKPDDEYPPNQIAKIKSLIASEADKQKENDSYSKFITEGNNAFNAEQYRKALSAFKKALGVKPTAPYPQQKIDEINGLLAELGNKQLEQQTAANNAAREEFLKNPYGEEVTGKYTEEDVNLILTRGRIDDDDYKAKVVEEFKDKEAKVLDEEINDQTDRSEQNELAYEDLETKRSEQDVNNDNPRQELIPEVDTYKDEVHTNESTRIQYETSVTYNNYKQNEVLETTRSEEAKNNDVPRQVNIPVVDEYKDDLSGIEEEKIDRQTEGTYDNYEAKERLDTDRNTFAVEADVPRQDNIVEVTDYKDDQHTVTKDYNDFNVERGYSNYEAKEQLDTDRNTFAVEADVPRQDNAIEVTDYKDDQHTVTKDYNDFNVERGYSNYEAKEQLDTDRNTFAVEADVPRQDNAIEVTDYKDDQHTVTKDYNDFNVERGYTNYETNEKLETSRNEEAVNNDKPRQENEVEMEDYKEENLNTTSENQSFNTDRTHKTYEENEVLETERTEWMSDADDPRQENIKEVEDYSSDRLNSKSEDDKNAVDQNVERTDELDDVKHQSPTMFSDENRQKLAEQYPEGVTEKMFERKDARGNVSEVTILRIVVSGNKGDEYKKVITKWGTNYFKNGGVISEYIWDTETN